MGRIVCQRYNVWLDSWSARSAYPFGSVYCYRYHERKSRIQLLLCLCSVLLLDTPTEEQVRAKGKLKMKSQRGYQSTADSKGNMEPWLVKRRAGG